MRLSADLCPVLKVTGNLFARIHIREVMSDETRDLRRACVKALNAAAEKCGISKLHLEAARKRVQRDSLQHLTADGYACAAWKQNLKSTLGPDLGPKPDPSSRLRVQRSLPQNSINGE